jgi:hypothetical protein
MTPFEDHLAASPRRDVPASWRARILANACHRPSLPLLLLAAFRTVFSFPHPLAWGAVAAGWVLIVVLNLMGPRGEALYAVMPAGYGDHTLAARDYFARLERERAMFLALESMSARPEQFPLCRPARDL